jgi:hypothetical protein
LKEELRRSSIATIKDIEDIAEEGVLSSYFEGATVSFKLVIHK